MFTGWEGTATKAVVGVLQKAWQELAKLVGRGADKKRVGAAVRELLKEKPDLSFAQEQLGLVGTEGKPVPAEVLRAREMLEKARSAAKKAARPKKAAKRATKKKASRPAVKRKASTKRKKSVVRKITIRRAPRKAARKKM